MKSKTLSTLLLVAGAALLLLGYFEPQIRAGFATVITDATPPVWGVNADGTLGLIPRDGQVLQTCTIIQVVVLDPESGVASVTAWVDEFQFDLPLKGGTPYGGIWQRSIPAVPIGTHTIKYNATNMVGLSTVYSGSFEVYTGGIQGIWYVNGIEISSSSQTVYSSSLTVNFTFSRTSPISPNTCSVVEGATSLLTLTSTDSSTWRGSYTFVGGSHTLTLTASDGTTSVIMAMISVDFGGLAVNFTTEQLAMFAVGACCLGGGGYLRLPKKKR